MTTKQQRYKRKNKEKTLICCRNYYENNKERILAQKKMSVTCQICDKIMPKSGYLKHTKTKEHFKNCSSKAEELYLECIDGTFDIKHTYHYWITELIKEEFRSRTRFYEDEKYYSNYLTIFKSTLLGKYDMEKLYKIIELDHNFGKQSQYLVFLKQIRDLYSLTEAFNQATKAYSGKKITLELYTKWGELVNTHPILKESYQKENGEVILISEILDVYRIDLL